MNPINVIAIHPEDNNLLSLISIFEERGDHLNCLSQWDEIGSINMETINLILIDVSLADENSNGFEEILSSKNVIFTDSQNKVKKTHVKLGGDRELEIQSSPYNRYQIEKSIIHNSLNLSKEKIQKKGKKRLFRIPLRYKISFPYLFLTLALGIFGAFILTRIVFDTVEDRFNNQLLEAGKINHEWLVNKESSLLETIRFIANIENIDQKITESDINSLRDFIYPVALNEELDSVRILDKKGIQLIGMDHVKGGNIEEYYIDINPEDFSNFQVSKNIINQITDDLGNKYSGLLQVSNNNILYIGGPVYNNDGELIGIVLVGENIESIVNDMRISTLTQVTIYDLNGEIEISTFVLPTAFDSELALNIYQSENEESHVRSFDIYDISYGEVLSPLVIRGTEVIGILGNALPKNFLLYSTLVTQAQIIVFFLLAIFLVMVLGTVISRIVSDPIMRLVQASKTVASGDYSVSINTFTGDEIEILANTFNTMVSSMRSSKEEILDAYDKSLDGWSRALELRDKETDYHCQRVADMTLKVAEEIGYPVNEFANLRRGALLHDIGKMGIPDEILLKPGKLNEQEWSIMKKHPTFAMDLMKDISFLHSSYEIPYCHHEHWDGSGYPNGLQGEDIPLSARIFAIVDVWDAMGSDRPYRKALKDEEIIDYIMHEKGSHFDPQVVDAFLKVKDKFFLDNDGI